MMDNLFKTAVNTLIGIYGSTGTLTDGDGHTVSVRISPVFPYRHVPESPGSCPVKAEGNILISGADKRPVPLADTLTEHGNVWTITAVSDIPACGINTGCYELVIEK